MGPATGGLATTATIAFDGCEGEALLVNLDLEGVSVSTGSACAVGGTEASPVLLAMGLPPRKAASTLRFSVGDGVEPSNVDRVVGVVGCVVARLLRIPTTDTFGNSAVRVSRTCPSVCEYATVCATSTADTQAIHCQRIVMVRIVGFAVRLASREDPPPLMQRRLRYQVRHRALRGLSGRRWSVP